MGAPYIYDINRLRVKDLHSATYIYVVRRLRVKTRGRISINLWNGYNTREAIYE